MDRIISVIITSFNHQDYIEQCIKSVFEQTYRSIELIIIDDGSTDETTQRISRILENDPFENTQFIIQKENRGVCYTRNEGLEIAKGDYFLFLDSDDFLDPLFIEKLLTKAEHEKADIVYCDLKNIDTNEIFMKAKTFDLISFLQGNYIINTSLIRRQAVGDSRYDIKLNREFLEDYDFMMNLILMKNAKAVYAENVSLNYRVLNNSISRKDNHTSREYFYKIYAYILKKYINNFPDEIFTALNANSLILEGRIQDLIEHLSDVTKYTEELKNENLENKEQIFQLKSNAETLQHINNILTQEKNEILQSKSYRIGNLVVKPISIINRVIHNPRLLKKGGYRLKNKIVRWYKKIPSPKRGLLKLVRDFQRSRYNTSNQKRFLIYVIYENQESVQKYKLLFLDAIAELCEEVLIVVNGNLSDSDRVILSNYGKVSVRKNVGYDTAAFRYGIMSLGKQYLKQFDELLLINDTNIGPIGDLATSFEKMQEKNLDFWGISYGEEQSDITGLNPYKYIPLHLQTFFLVIRKTLLNYSGFYDYWEALNDTNSRNKAIGFHETVFTKHFNDLGFRHGALAANNQDSAMYIHPLTMLKEGVPLIKYSALNNYNDEKFLWQGLQRHSEVPDLLDYLEQQTSYPIEEIEKIMSDIKNKEKSQYILIIDGVENIIPQCTRYRVVNKAEQLRLNGFNVKTVNMSQFRLSDAENASLIIIYRYGYCDLLAELCLLAKQFNKTVLYDIDDLVIDTKYTDQLPYTQQLSEQKKQNYDAGVKNYGRMLRLCDGAITSTSKLQKELSNYQDLVLLNRNLASQELVEISNRVISSKVIGSNKVKLGYFSGSITHNEDFNLIKNDVARLLKKHSNVELHLVGHLTIPDELSRFHEQIIFHDYVDWNELPSLISQVDINLAPLTNSIFNEAKSEIKWLEAALVKVPTVASNLGTFKKMINNGVTGVLVDDNDWYDCLERLVLSADLRQEIANNAYNFVLNECVTSKEDSLVEYLRAIKK
ncbi:rhamnan synthesis F family protein [Enterococcus sp. DIV0756]|uniref:rhamnan synthesis F family protein n=1 Tax=Enterococcus sp. DIV0756 TaxID=2774636 RepID=UPI003F298988